MHDSWNALKKLEMGCDMEKNAQIKQKSLMFQGLSTLQLTLRFTEDVSTSSLPKLLNQMSNVHYIEPSLHLFLSLLLSAFLKHINRTLFSPAIIHTPVSACPVAKLKLLKPGKIRGEPGHALMACEGHSLSFCSPRARAKQTVAISGMSSFIHAC